MTRGLFIPLFAALLVTPLVGCNGDPQQKARQALERGNQQLAQNKYPEAIIEYRRAVQADPRLGTARLKLADAYASWFAGQSKDHPSMTENTKVRAQRHRAERAGATSAEETS